MGDGMVIASWLEALACVGGVAPGDRIAVLACFAKVRRFEQLRPCWTGALAGAVNERARGAARRCAGPLRSRVCLHEAPHYVSRNLSSAAALAHLGRLKDVKAVVQKLLSIDPGPAVEHPSARSNCGATPKGAPAVEGLRLAGPAENCLQSVRTWQQDKA